MAKLTKRARLIAEKVDSTKEYPINEAVALLKELATAKFAESVDVAVNLVLPVANLQLWIIPKVAWTMEDMRETAKTNKELSTVVW